MPMDIDMDEVVAIALRAGARIMELRPEIIPKHEGQEPHFIMKDDGSPVTKADLESNAIITEALSKLTPDIPIVTEETEKELNERILNGQDTYWMVDPLDITMNYAIGGDAFSVNIALIEKDVATRGVLFFPALEDLFYTGTDGHAYRKQKEQRAEQIAIPPLGGEKGLKASADNPFIVATKDRISQVNPKDKVADNIKAVPSAGQHRACLVAAGTAMLCSEKSGYRIWDSAPTDAIVKAAGGEIRTLDGNALSYKTLGALPAYFVGHPSLLDRMISTSSNGTGNKKS